MTTETRIYKMKDVEMLLTSSIIIETAIQNKVFLINKRATWADPFFTDLQTKIDTVIKKHLGIDSAKDLRKFTATMYSLQKDAKVALAEFKVQIDADFKKDPTKQAEILNVLGFNKYLKDVQKGNQEALINLLYQFKTNLDKGLETEIITKGINKATIDALLSFADTVKDTNVSQETAKNVKSTTTTNYITEFNNLYEEVIAVAKIAAKFYLDNPTLKEQFSFSRVSKAISAEKVAAVKPPKTDTPKK